MGDHELKKYDRKRIWIKTSIYKNMNYTSDCSLLKPKEKGLPKSPSVNIVILCDALKTIHVTSWIRCRQVPKKKQWTSSLVNKSSNQDHDESYSVSYNLYWICQAKNHIESYLKILHSTKKFMDTYKSKIFTKMLHIS